MQNSRLAVELEGLGYKGVDNGVECSVPYTKIILKKENPQVIIDENSLARNIFANFSGEVMANSNVKQSRLPNWKWEGVVELSTRQQNVLFPHFMLIVKKSAFKYVFMF